MQRMKLIVSAFVWMPRLLAIASILFLGLFAFDAYSVPGSFWYQTAGFILQLLPSIILTLFLIVAWKWPFAGGMLFLIAGLGLSPGIYMHNHQLNQSVTTSLGILLVTTFPIIFTGVLFLLSQWFVRRHDQVSAQDEAITGEKAGK